MQQRRAESTLCGQQYDPALLLAYKPDFASLLNPNDGFNLPGINVQPETPSDEILQLGFNCLVNFPLGYLLGEPAIPSQSGIMPVEDVRTGQVLVWVQEGGQFVVYKAMVEVITNSIDPNVAELAGYTLKFADGSGPFNTFADAQAHIAAGTGAVEIDLELSNESSVAFEIKLRVKCMERDPIINGDA